MTASALGFGLDTMYATMRFSFLHLGTTEAVMPHRRSSEVMLPQRPVSAVNVSELLVSESLVSESLVSESYRPYDPEGCRRDESFLPRLSTGSSGRKTLHKHDHVVYLQCQQGWDRRFNDCADVAELLKNCYCNVQHYTSQFVAVAASSIIMQ